MFSAPGVPASPLAQGATEKHQLFALLLAVVVLLEMSGSKPWLAPELPVKSHALSQATSSISRSPPAEHGATSPVQGATSWISSLLLDSWKPDQLPAMVVEHGTPTSSASLKLRHITASAPGATSSDSGIAKSSTPSSVRCQPTSWMVWADSLRISNHSSTWAPGFAWISLMMMSPASSPSSSKISSQSLSTRGSPKSSISPGLTPASPSLQSGLWKPGTTELPVSAHCAHSSPSMSPSGMPSRSVSLAS